MKNNILAKKMASKRKKEEQADEALITPREAGK
jgi:hypothetical protein